MPSLSKMKITELKEELKNRGLSPAGNKEALIARLNADRRRTTPESSYADSAATPTTITTNKLSAVKSQRSSLPNGKSNSENSQQMPVAKLPSSPMRTSPTKRNLTPLLTKERVLPASEDDDYAIEEEELESDQEEGEKEKRGEHKRMSPRVTRTSLTRDPSLPIAREHPVTVLKNTVLYLLSVTKEVLRGVNLFYLAVLVAVIAVLVGSVIVLGRLEGGPYQEVLEAIRRTAIWHTYWAVLGAMSGLSILGRASHTFSHHLSPFIVRVATKAGECGSVKFPVFGEGAFKCTNEAAPLQAFQGAKLLFLTLIKVYPEILSWVAGHLVPDLVVYLIARFGSLAPNPFSSAPVGVANFSSTLMLALNPLFTSLMPLIAGYSTVDTDSFLWGLLAARLLITLARAFALIFFAMHGWVDPWLFNVIDSTIGRFFPNSFTRFLQSILMEERFRTLAHLQVTYGWLERALTAIHAMLYVTIVVQAMRVASRSYQQRKVK